MNPIVVQNGATNGKKKGVRSVDLFSRWHTYSSPCQGACLQLCQTGYGTCAKLDMAPCRMWDCSENLQSLPTLLRMLATDLSALLSPYVSGCFYCHQQSCLPAPQFLPGGYRYDDESGGERERMPWMCLTSCFSIFFFSLCTLESCLLLRVESTFLWFKVKLHRETSKFCFWYQKEVG